MCSKEKSNSIEILAYTSINNTSALHPLSIFFSLSLSSCPPFPASISASLSLYKYSLSSDPTFHSQRTKNKAQNNLIKLNGCAELHESQTNVFTPFPLYTYLHTTLTQETKHKQMNNSPKLFLSQIRRDTNCEPNCFLQLFWPRAKKTHSNRNCLTQFAQQWTNFMEIFNRTISGVNTFCFDFFFSLSLLSSLPLNIYAPWMFSLKNAIYATRRMLLCFFNANGNLMCNILRSCEQLCGTIEFNGGFALFLSNINWIKSLYRGKKKVGNLWKSEKVIAKFLRRKKFL